MPEQQQLSQLRESFLQIESLRHHQQLWQRILLATQFYITYSHHKPKLDDPEQMKSLLWESANGSRSQRAIAESYGATTSTIVNSWTTMHQILTICLSAGELHRLGIPAATLTTQSEQIKLRYLLYTTAISNLDNCEPAQEILKNNQHYYAMMQTLAAGKGIKSFADAYIGWEYVFQYFPRLDITEGSFRTGLADDSAYDPEQNRSRATYNYSFLRRAVFGRYLSQAQDGTINGGEITPASMIHSLHRIMELKPDTQVLNVIQAFIPKLPHYEAALSPNPVYRKQVTRMDYTEYLKMYEYHNLLPLPIEHILKQEVANVSQVDTAQQLSQANIYYSPSTLRNEISAVGGMMENILLKPKLGVMSPGSFHQEIMALHNQDIAVLTAVAAGRSVLLES